MRRRRLQLRGSALSLTAVALAVAVVGAGAAIGDTVRAGAASEVVLKRGDRGPAVRRVQRRVHVSADGIFGRQTERAVKRFQRRHHLLVDGIVGPQTRRAMRLRRFSRRSVYRRRSSRRVRLPRALVRIAECESGGNPRAVSSSGRYRGKYQFTRGTWKALGGRGDPAKAPEWLQDRLALRLYRKRGTAPWPSCA